MKNILLLCTLFMGTTTVAQNLVSNPNFTIHTGCPSHLGQTNICTSWGRPSQGTSDYFHTCATNPMVAIPQNTIGYQASASGSYTGSIYYSANATDANYREYLYTQFAPLQVGATYKMSVSVSLADSSFYATDGMGVLFSKDFSLFYHYVNITNTPQVDYSSYGIITDKENWVTLTKNFVADSAYTQLIIGNFKSDAATNISACAYHCVAGRDLDSVAYYYIDSVSLEKIAEPSLITGSAYGTEAGLYPNPFNDYCTLTFNNDSRNGYILDVYNVQGQTVRSIGNIFTNKIRIEKGNLPTGFYYYKLHSADGVAANGKFIIRD